MGIIDTYLDDLEREIKKHGENTAHFIQIGDFYEMYGVQYADGSYRGNLPRISDLTSLNSSVKKTCVGGDKDNVVYMIGFPMRALDKFLNMMVDQFGWTVVVEKQDEQKSGTSRSILGVFSPGTNVRSYRESNNLVSIYLESSKSQYLNPGQVNLYCGMSSLDCLTGEACLYETYGVYEPNSLSFDEVQKFINVKSPREVLIHNDNLDISDDDLVSILNLDDRHYRINYNMIGQKEKRLDYQTKFFEAVYPIKVQSNIIDHLQLSRKDFARLSFLILLRYINDHASIILHQINEPEIWEHNSQLVLANNSLEQLNVVDNRFMFKRGSTSLIKLLNKASTCMGRRGFKNHLLNPIKNPEEINRRYNLVEEMMDCNGGIPNQDFYLEIEKVLAKIRDIEKIHRKMSMRSIVPYELITLDTSYEAILEIVELIQKSKKTKLVALLPGSSFLTKFKEFIKTYRDTLELDLCTFNTAEKMDVNIFKPGHSKELDEIQETINFNQAIIDGLGNKISKIIGETDKAGNIKDVVYTDFNDRLGTYIYCTSKRYTSFINKMSNMKLNELEWKVVRKRGNERKVKKFNIPIDKLEKKKKSISSKSDNNVIIYCSNIHVASKELRVNNELLRKLLAELFLDQVSKWIDTYNPILKSIVDFVMQLDIVKSCAKVAIQNGYVRPTIKEIDGEGSYVNLKGMRHPIIEKIQTRIPYVPIDISIGKDGLDGMLLFSANACGKSSVMKAVGLSIILAQAGMFVPADKMEYYPYDYLFTRIWNNDNLFKGQSSFAVEIEELKSILKYAGSTSLVLGDELCSGTETVSASAIVAAGIMTLAKKKTNFIFATHLHFLSNNSHLQKLTNVKNFHLTVRYDEANQKLIYDRVLKPGAGPSIYGLEVCKAIGLDKEFMDLAHQLREEITEDSLESFLGKSSTYNANKFVGLCEVCGNKGEDVHHIKFQCTADLNGMIGKIHKNIENNLVTLCKECHKRVHKKKPKLIINGYVQTTNGIELDYRDKK